MSEGSGDSSRELEIRIEELLRRVEAIEEKVIRGGCFTGPCVAVCICCGTPPCVSGVRIEFEPLKNAPGEAEAR